MYTIQSQFKHNLHFSVISELLVKAQIPVRSEKQSYRSGYKSTQNNTCQNNQLNINAQAGPALFYIGFSIDYHCIQVITSA